MPEITRDDQPALPCPGPGDTGRVITTQAGRAWWCTRRCGCPHCTEYLAQMRKTLELTRSLTSDDLTPQMPDEFIAIYRKWHAGQDG